jgi:uncharacterized protein (DUF2141 family)
MKSSLKLLAACLTLLVLNYHVCAQVTFAPAASYTVGLWPGSAMAMDVNGDGKVDLICKNSGYFYVSVLTNNGSGDFVLSSSPSVDGGVSWVTAADINGDGKVDLICDSYYELDTLSMMTNDGSGGFALSSKVVMPYADYSFMAADFNQDNKVDLISAAFNTLSVYTNDGTGSFTFTDPYAVGTWPRLGPVSIIAADVNMDGRMDLICANPYDNTLSLLTNNGNGGLVLGSTLAVGNGSYTVAAADLNGDGKVDLICANSYDNTLLVFTNNGSGGFVTNATYAVGPYPYSVTAADLNGDGKLDLICANNGSNTLSVLTNNGSGSFTLASTPNVGSGPFSVVAADVNGDGKLDLICANGSSNTLTVLINTSVFPPPTFIPTLTINRQSNGMHVSWPSASAGWSLQQNANLITTNWSPSVV